MLFSVLFPAAVLLLFAAWPEASAAGGRNQPSFSWLDAADGRPRGVVLSCDLERDADAWELWGPAAGRPALVPLTDLVPADRLAAVGFAVNGGYWNEHAHPVGVAAGAQGILAAHAHPSGFAIAGRRAWIGELHPLTRLRPATDDAPASAALPVPLNPWPPPRRTPYLVDPKAYPWPVQLEPPAVAVRLESEEAAPLRFNTVRLVQVARLERPSASTNLELTSHPLLVLPRGMPADWPLPAPAEGVRYRLELRLLPLEAPVRLATCAGPILLDEGKVPEGLSVRQTWRTAVGIDAEGRRLWLVALARGRDGALGATLPDAAHVLQDLGAWSALNLDGGSSTSVYCPPAQVPLQTLFPIRRPIHHALFFMRPVASETILSSLAR
jgi:uncharacterized protein YigE (DUF2233 family)